MSLVKESQSFLEGADVPIGAGPELEIPPDQQEIPPDQQLTDELSVIDLNFAKHDKHSEDDIIVVEGPEEEVEVENEPEIILTLDKIPGALSQDEIEEPAEIEVEEPEEIEINNDPWDFGELHNLLPWISKMMQNVPKHSGVDVPGLDRTIAYFKHLKQKSRNAVQTDINSVLDINAVSTAYKEIENAIDRLEERREKIESRSKKKRKRADDDQDGLVKTAATPKINGITVTVPLLISSLARTLINSTVSAGKDMERSFVSLADEYNLSKREKLELMQLLYDMNFPIRRDLGAPLDKEIDTTSVDNFNWMPNYHA